MFSAAKSFEILFWKLFLITQCILVCCSFFRHPVKVPPSDKCSLSKFWAFLRRMYVLQIKPKQKMVYLEKMFLPFRIRCCEQPMKNNLDEWICKFVRAFSFLSYLLESISPLGDKIWRFETVLCLLFYEQTWYSVYHKTYLL